MNSAPITIGLVDDHKIFRQALTTCFLQSGNYLVTLQAGNGKELLENIHRTSPPQILILDLHMPIMDGFETLHWLQQNYALLPVIILSERDTTETASLLIQLGVRAIFKKNVDLTELKKAINRVVDEGYYFSKLSYRSLWEAIYPERKGRVNRKNIFTERKWRFLKLSGTNLTYPQIADLLKISNCGIKKLQHELFVELSVRNRAELAVLAEKHGICLNEQRP